MKIKDLWVGDRFRAHGSLWTYVGEGTARKHSAASIALGAQGHGYIGDTVCGFEPDEEVAFIPPVAEWLPIESAPKDGTIIVGKYKDTECLIRWSERPVCMLGPVNGGYPPGWATAGDETDNNLPMDPPTAWKPEE